jgi:hypothetical protein
LEESLGLRSLALAKVLTSLVLPPGNPAMHPPGNRVDPHEGPTEIPRQAPFLV